jgi:hypothetical protein
MTSELLSSLIGVVSSSVPEKDRLESAVAKTRALAVFNVERGPTVATHISISDKLRQKRASTVRRRPAQMPLCSTVS